MTHAETIRAASTPLAAQPTGEAPRLQPLPGIRSVVFDLYGTLFISAAGDISLADDGARDDLLRKAIEQGTDETMIGDGDHDLSGAYFRMIQAHQAVQREAGITYPEVEIREVWRDLLEELVSGKQLPSGTSTGPETCEAIAVAYECAANPVWPMPHLEPTLAALADRGLPLGIVSNAQFYTLHLFPAFLEGRERHEVGFDPGLEVFSFQEREGKPSRRLYDLLAEKLKESGLSPSEVLYVGNDLRNDTWPAQVVGFRTALFAGDQRSLRWREDDPRVAGVVPDLVLTDLAQIPEVLA